MADHVVRRKFGCPVDGAAVAGDWRVCGYSCDLFVDPPGREWSDFVHARNELVTVVEGRLEVKVAGSRFVAEPGDEVFIPKGELHSMKNVHATHPVVLWLRMAGASGQTAAEIEKTDNPRLQAMAYGVRDADPMPIFKQHCCICAHQSNSAPAPP